MELPDHPSGFRGLWRSVTHPWASVAPPPYSDPTRRMNKPTDNTSTAHTVQSSDSAGGRAFSDPASQSDPPADPPADPRRPIPAIRSPLPPSEAVDRLALLSKRGKLPGFQRQPAQGTTEKFQLLVFGNPYDRILLGTAAPSDTGSQITLECRLLRKIPIFVIAVMVFALFPGVLVTHSMLSVWFSWYTWNEWITVAWYVPLFLLAVPALIKQYRNSERAAAIDLAKRVEQVLVATEGSS